jgi:hypothetical protein
MEAPPFRNATSVGGGQPRSVGTDTSSQQLFLVEMKAVNAQMEASLMQGDQQK